MSRLWHEKAVRMRADILSMAGARIKQAGTTTILI